MKSLLAAVAMIVLTSCGRVESQSSLDALPAGIPVVFEKDERGFDGYLTSITLVQNSAKFTTVTIRTVGGVANTHKVNKLGDKFVCKSNGKVRLNLECSTDQRPVDGALTVLSIVETSNALFTAKITYTYVDRRTGKDIVVTDAIASEMTRRYLPQNHTL